MKIKHADDFDALVCEWPEDSWAKGRWRLARAEMPGDAYVVTFEVAPQIEDLEEFIATSGIGSGNARMIGLWSCIVRRFSDATLLVLRFGGD